MYKLKTRTVYGKDIRSGMEYLLCSDSVAESLRLNMLVKDYEKILARLNPQLEITVKITEKTVKR